MAIEKVGGGIDHARTPDVKMGLGGEWILVRKRKSAKLGSRIEQIVAGIDSDRLKLELEMSIIIHNQMHCK